MEQYYIINYLFILIFQSLFAVSYLLINCLFFHALKHLFISCYLFTYSYLFIIYLHELNSNICINTIKFCCLTTWYATWSTVGMTQM
jgi:hypothetical protein